MVKSRKAKFWPNLLSKVNAHQKICACLSLDVYLKIVSGALPYNMAWNLTSTPLNNGGQMSFLPISFQSHIMLAKRLVRPHPYTYNVHLECEHRAFSHKYLEPVRNFCQFHWELILLKLYNLNVVLQLAEGYGIVHWKFIDLINLQCELMIPLK